jgi:predicted GNAT superfamily acetyltransferase
VTASAWDLAHDAAMAAGVQLRALSEVSDGAAVIEVMRATWGGHDLLPPEMIRALSMSGNVPYGAFDGDEMIGYVLGWAGVDPVDGLHVHSHMLAAMPGRRHRGVGFALKLAQRAQSLDQGIGLIRWTFDPMIARNAWFNLGKLGAVADRFERDLYGAMTDELNLGERSDRLVIAWRLDQEPGPRALPEGGTAIPVPRDYPSLRAADRPRAGAERDRVADALATAFARGLVAVGFDVSASAYVLAESGDAP